MVGELKIDNYFSKDTMSVHLKEGVEAVSKAGKPGAWTLKKISKNILTSDDVQDIAQEIIESAEKRDDGFVEIKREGSSIIQLGNYRIVITMPPLSDGWEITAVRPIITLKLSDYKLTDKLNKRIKTGAEGILISGAPGEGKSTFVQALASDYSSQKKIVKTIEAPRDLALPKEVTQYAVSRAEKNEIRDILLLSRPDYTLFDEMRNTDDFRLFADLRLSGVGMVGVVHATNPVDAIQRFIGRIELGVIPHVIDTVIFIKAGKIERVYEVMMEIKVPAGMTEKDLTRPIVTVKDFETGTPEFEIYSYGEDTVVVPIKEETKKSAINIIVEKNILELIKKYSKNAKAEVIDENTARVTVPEKDASRIIGKNRQNIEKLEKELNLKLNIVGKQAEKEKKIQKAVKFKVESSEKSMHLIVGERYTDKTIDVCVNDDYILSAKVGKKGSIKIKKDSDVGKEVVEGIKRGKVLLLV